MDIRRCDLVAIIALACLTRPGVAAQNPPPPQPIQQPARDRPRPAAATATIRGRVFAAETQAPLRRARVNFTSDAPGAPVDLSPKGVMTGADGRYEFTGLPPGRYRVFAKRTGYGQADFGAKRAGAMGRALPTDSERGVTIELAEGQAFDNADLYLPKAGAITGRVFDENGDALVGAFVGVTRRDRSGGRTRMVAFGTDMTDDRGVYRLSGLPAGDYYVVISAPFTSRMRGQSTTYADILYPGVGRRDQATPIRIAVGQEVADVNVTMTPIRMARVSGTVMTSGRAPASDTSISWEGGGAESGLSSATVMSAQTNRDGAFAIPSVGPGEYDVSVQVQTEQGEEMGSQHVSVWGTDITGVVIVTAPAGQLRGTVRTESGAPLPANAKTPPRVTTTRVAEGNDPLFSTPGAGPVPGRIADDGTFSMSVMPGSRLLDVMGLPAEWAVARVSAGDRDLTDTPLDVPPGTQLDVEIVVTNRMASLAGAVVDSDGKPTWDYRVIAFPKDPAKWAPGLGLVKVGRPNQMGQFRLDRLRPGDYYVVATQGGDVEWGDAAVLESLKGMATEVTLVAGEVRRAEMKVVRNEGR